MKSILIVEDNKDINGILSESLRGEGYNTVSLYDGLTAVDTIKNGSFCMVLLDIMLPYISGDRILKEIRTFSSIPVIIISAKDMVDTKVDLLKLGADDYIVKPFDLKEVAARIESNIRRSAVEEEEKKNLIYKDIVMDTEGNKVSVNNKEIILTAKEYQLLKLMLENQNKVFSKSNIYETIWQEEYLGDDNAVKTHISNLRNKLKKASGEENYIETVWGMGYRLCRK